MHQARQETGSMDMKALKEENRLLLRENRACREQGLLFESLLKMVGSASEQKVLRHTMKTTLDITARLSGAQIRTGWSMRSSGLWIGFQKVVGQVMISPLPVFIESDQIKP